MNRGSPESHEGQYPQSVTATESNQTERNDTNSTEQNINLWKILTDKGTNVFWQNTCIQMISLDESFWFYFMQCDFCSQADLTSDLTWQIKSVISWKKAASCISKGHPLAHMCSTHLISHKHKHWSPYLTASKHCSHNYNNLFIWGNVQRADHKLLVTYGFIPWRRVTRRQTHGCKYTVVNATELIAPCWPERGQGQEVMLVCFWPWRNSL